MQRGPEFLEMVHSFVAADASAVRARWRVADLRYARTRTHTEDLRNRTRGRRTETESARNKRSRGAEPEPLPPTREENAQPADLPPRHHSVGLLIGGHPPVWNLVDEPIT